MSHFNGISWKVPSGNVLLIVMGRIPLSNSFNAMSMGLVKVVPSTSTSIGALMDIWSALAPTILAFSNRVIFGGPIVIFSCSGVS